MKNFKNKLVSCVLAAVTAFTVSVSIKKYAPITVSAASNERFLSEVALVYKDSVEEARAAIAGTDWQLFEEDLNKNAQLLGQDGAYLVYKTSTDVEDAITDLRVMDMYGGYTTTNYTKELEKTRKTYETKIEGLRVAAAEFKTNYEAGDDMAKLAYRQMNYYQDVKTENGTETGMKMGEFFLNMPTETSKIIQVVFEGNTIIVSNLISLLAVGISGADGTSLATRIAEAYKNKGTLTDEGYHEKAKALAKSFETIKEKLIRYDALKEEYNFQDEEISEAELMFLSEYATISELTKNIPFGETNLNEFIKGDWKTEDLYPIVAAFTKGQAALVEMGQLETVLKYNSPSKSIDELVEMVEEMEKEMKIDAPYDVYTGVDRELFKGDFAMTNAAERQQALTGETWDWGSAASRSLGVSIGYIVASVVDVAMVGTFAGIAIKKANLEAAAGKLMSDYNAYAAAYNKASAFSANWSGVQFGCFVGAIALTVIILGTYGITTWYNYYNPKYLEIPNTLIDVKETDVGDKYIKYSAAKVLNGEEGQENADFNAYEGKEWNALYYTKDANAGNCLTASFVHKDKTNLVSKRHQGISMFGEDVAFNLNSHAYKGGAPAVYLSVRYSTAKKAAADMPTVVGSMVIHSEYYAISALIGVALGAGGVVIIQSLKKKKKTDVVEDITTTEK